MLTLEFWPSFPHAKENTVIFSVQYLKGEKKKMLLHHFKYYDYLMVIFSLYGVFKTRLLLKQFVSMLMVYILIMINTNGMEDLYKIMTLTFVEGCKSRK